MGTYMLDLTGNKATFRKIKNKKSEENNIKGGNKDSYFKSGGFSDGVDGAGDFFGKLGKTVLGTGGDITVGVAKGVTRTVENLSDLTGYLGGTARPYNLGDIMSQKPTKEDLATNFTDEMWQPAVDYVDKYSVLGNKADAISEGVGQVATTILTGTAGGAAGLGTAGVTALTSGLMGATAMGGGMSEAYQGGATDGEALKYGLISGASEAGTELLFGGLGKVTGAVGLTKGILSVDDALAKKVSGKFSSQIAKNFAEYGIKAGAEGTEEVLSGIVQAWGKSVTYMSEEDLGELIKDEQLLDQFIAGAVTSGIAQSGYVPGMKNGSLREANAAGRDFITGNSRNEQAVINKVVEEHINEMKDVGEKVTARKRTAIEEQVQKDLQRGYISTDTIESVLGGEDYRAYTELEKEMDEFNTLNRMKKSEMTGEQEDRLAELKEKNKVNPYEGEKTRLKGLLSQTVQGMVKSDRLVESYNEKGRRSQAFEADLSQYDEKQRAIIQNAIDSGILNNTNRTHEFVDMIAKISADKGVSFNFTNNQKLQESGFALTGKTVNGYIQDGSVVLNLNSAKALNKVVGHEITHVLEGTELYQELQNSIIEYAKTKGDYDARWNSIVKLYSKQFQGQTNEARLSQYKAELTADLVGDYLFTDESFVKNLSAEKPNIFKKIYEEIKYFVKSVAPGSKEAKQLEQVKKVFDEVYRNNLESDVRAEVQYSLVGKDENGIEIYETSEDTKKLSYAERKAKLLDSMRNTYAGRTAKFTKNGQTYYAQFNAAGLNKGVYGDKKSGRNAYNAKINIGADGNYIELAENAIYTGTTKEQGKSNRFHSDAQTWDYYVKTIQSDGKYFDVLVNVKDTGNSQYVYDITLKEATHQRALKHLRLGEATSDSSISQNEKNATKKLKKTDKSDGSRQRSVGNEEDIAPSGTYNVQGSDIELELPIRDDVAPVQQANETVQQQIRNHLDELIKMESVSEITTESDMSNWNKQDIVQWTMKQLESTGYEIEREGYGKIVFGKKQIKQSMSYMKMEDMETYVHTLMPEVLKRGIEIESRANHKGREYGTKTFAAPVEINGERGIMAVVVKETTKNFYKVHRIVTPDGSVFKFEQNNKAALPNDGGVTDNSSLAASTSSASINSISDSPEKSTTFSMEDIGPVREDIRIADSEDLNSSGKEDVAPVQQAEVDKYLKAYSEHQKNNWKASKNIIVYESVEQLSEFVDESLRSGQHNKKMHFGMINDEVAQRVKSETGIEVADYNVVLYGSEIRKIINNSHGNAKREADRGQRVITKEDIMRIPEIIGNPDSIIKGDGEYGGHEVVKFIKTINGRETVVTYVQTNKHDIRVQTMYAGVNKKSLAITPGDQDVFPHTSETLNGTAFNGNSLNSVGNNSSVNATHDSSASINSISDSPEKSTTFSMEDIGPVREYITPRDVEKIITVKERNAQILDNHKIELQNNISLREQSHNNHNRTIAELQEQYEALADKTSVEAAEILQKMEKEKRLRDNVDAMYEKRISDMESRIDKMQTEEFKRAEQRMTKDRERVPWIRELIGDTSTWVDKKLGLQYQMNTMKRNLRDIIRDADGKRDIAKADAIYDAIPGRYNHQEALLNKEENKIKAPVAEMKINEYESTYIQMLGEYRENPDTTLSADVMQEYYEKHETKIDKNKVEKAIRTARKVYDELFQRVNEVLAEQGFKPMAYREGYFPHFTQPEQGKVAKLLNWKIQDNSIPTDIAGLTEMFQPERSWQSFDKHRNGDVTDYDFLTGFDTYVHGALDWIYHIEDIQNLRTLEREIRYQHSEKGVQEQIDAVLNNEEYDADTVQNELEKIYDDVQRQQIDKIINVAKNPLNNFVQDLRRYTNNLAGKKDSSDRGMEAATNRKVYSVMTNISNRVSANMVAVSFSSALTNFIPITQSWGEVSPVSTLRAMKETVRSIIRDDGMIEKSDFMTNRLRPAENLKQTAWDKIGNAAGCLMEAIDSFTTQTVWRSKYHENIQQGMSENEAISNADSFSEGLMAGRSRGNMPTIFNAKNPVTKLFTAFQLEVANQYAYMFKDMPQNISTNAKGKLVKGYLTMFAGAYVYNMLYSNLVGRDAALDPVGIIEDFLKDLFGDDEDDEGNVLEAVEGLGMNLAQEVPFIGGILGGGRVPLSSALPYDGDFSELMGAVGDGDLSGIMKEMLNPLYYMALPMGGGQIRKTTQGLSMFDDDLPIAGSYTDSGNLRFPVEDTVGSRIKAALFGQWADKNAQDYIENERNPLNAKQIQEYKDVDIPIADYWKYREVLKEQKNLEEKFDYIDSLELPVEKKNILVNNIVDRQKDVFTDYFEEFDFYTKNPEKYEFLRKTVNDIVNKKEYIDMEDYDEFADFEEFDFAIKNPEKYDFLQNNHIAYTEYNASEDSRKAYNWAYNNPEKYTVSKAVTDDVVTYKQYTKEISDIKADTYSNGKAISGSAKNKVIQYLNSLDIDYGAKLILFKDKYPSDDKYNYEIVEYLNNRDDISRSEMETILVELGFTVDAEGNVTW